MCNLNILLRRNEDVEKHRITSFIQSVTSHSFATNNDGEGFFADGKILRSLYKINYYDYKDIIEKAKLIITHQRFATSGFHMKYTQPLISKEFLIVHNGIMNDFVFGEPSDTYRFFKSFLIRFEKEQDSNRERRIVRAIKDLLMKTEMCNSFSIVLLDRVSQNMYFFKNYLTKIHFYKSDGILYITTSEDNKNLLELFRNHDFREVFIEDDIIYRVDSNLEITPIDEIDSM